MLMSCHIHNAINFQYLRCQTRRNSPWISLFSPEGAFGYRKLCQLDDLLHLLASTSMEVCFTNELEAKSSLSSESMKLAEIFDQLRTDAAVCFGAF